MASISTSNIQAILHAPEPRLTQNLKKVFARLVDPREDPKFVESYAQSIRNEFRRSIEEHQDAPHFSPFVKACINAGIVKTMLAVARKEWTGPRVSGTRYSAQSNAMQCLFELMRSGDIVERRELLDIMLREDIVGLCLQMFVHELGIMRQVAASTMHILSSDSFLGECISPSTAADIIEAACLLTLRTRSDAISELVNPDTGETRVLRDGKSRRVEILNRIGNPPRFYVMDLEEGLRTVHGVLCTSPPRPRKFYLDILKRKPRVLDLLFDCAILGRPQWHPETQVDSMACAMLSFLFAWPPHTVAGVATPTDKAFKTQELRVMSQTMAILTSRPDWVEQLVEIWMRIQEEDLKQVRRCDPQVSWCVSRLVALIPSLNPTSGVSRITVLRIITTLTHVAETCSITNTQLESFLYIAYVGCRKVKSTHNSSIEEHRHLRAENDQEMFRKPAWTDTLHITPKSPITVAPENVLGPTALIRLLTVLAQRKTLDGIQLLREPPLGLSPTTSLEHIQLITHPDVIRRTIIISQKRLRARMDVGRDRVAAKSVEGDWDLACAAFTSSAELAAALVALDTHTGGVYKKEIRGARKQLVVALGNASQMALNLKQYARALHYGWGAVNAAENIPVEEGLDPGIMEKNKRRVDHASAGLQPSLPQ
ncbi:hypothetical protein CONPUDRAFT_109512 [Coniophora puteana RWD-64-598 SS2]|uniref:Uncharacterized protein n=1 Tax=Coniophora puteana (strain RWD-64-598) TaxID=741705 RepID=A0A5M3MEP3_CONPW|nr:uncharacterized protein CONPUDRAFT_109512 [Coniophora puteana RWD-64-598 SS2]EIW77051.1 hypothetical protein CONPUDRAFT_109512 [Coniophora puteana RWD-64-598 SS2]